MKKFLLAAIILSVSAPAIAQVRVKGYTTRNGTYVAPHYRSRPNNSTIDNYSTQGNYNPYTGRRGTASPYSTPSYTTPSYKLPRLTSPSYDSPYGDDD